MARFATAARLVSWAGLAPDDNQPACWRKRKGHEAEREGWAGEAEGRPSSRRHYLDVPRPIRRRVPDGSASRLFTASLAFTVISAARLPLLPPHGRDLSRRCRLRYMLRTVQSLPLTGLSARAPGPRPFPDHTASLLPGLLAATRTGLTPASDDELTNAKNTIALRHGVTSRSAGHTKGQG